MNKPKVIVAMSGGVDSSVAAALLKKAGFEVSGVFLNLFDSPRFREGGKQAKNIAKILKIPFFIFDFRKEFEKKVIDYFLKEYKAGLTPNPCVVCNKKIKFGVLLKKVQNMGANYLATGHYARIKNSKLLKGKDKEKDQSYFLWRLSQSQLKHILFPIGGYTKSEVKKFAKKFKILSQVRPESQEICFVRTTVNNFLKQYLKQKPGKIITSEGKIIGQHQGLWFYTIGQRKGIKLAGGPYYVLDKNLRKNLLIVTKNEKDLLKKELILKRVHWISGKAPKLPLKVKAKIRYLHPASSATIYPQMPTGDTQQNAHCSHTAKYKIQFSRPQRAITPGQSVVFYLPRRSPETMVWGRDQEILGGGIIC